MSGDDASNWRVFESRGGFNDVFGDIRARVEPDGRARCRVETGPAQANPRGDIHGGFLLAFADHVAFVGLLALDRLPTLAVTLDASVKFIGRGEPGMPLDALVEVIGETGRMLFVRGLFEQEARVIASFEATLRKGSAAADRGMTTPLARYDALVAAGELRPDPDQRGAALALDALAAGFEAVPPRGGLFRRVLGKAAVPPRGIYLWGGVGRGKSMLMDLFFDCAGVAAKRRVHFHEFMIEVHGRLRVERSREAGDPVAPVAAALASEARMLCFDEMVVNNSADAMILSRLFTALIVTHGVTVVATSNRRPGDLYKDGLNREHFLPFIALVEARLDVLALNGPTDFRLERLGGFPTWYVPNGHAATDALSRAFFRLTDFPVEDRANVPAAELPVSGGRTLHVPKSIKGVAVFSFARLCREARGAADYLAIARHYHTVIVVGVPLMGPDNRNEAARFVTLVDALYEHKVKLLAAADAEPAALYRAGDGAFEFERTVSRLMEMRSADYLAQGHGID